MIIFHWSSANLARDSQLIFFLKISTSEFIFLAFFFKNRTKFSHRLQTFFLFACFYLHRSAQLINFHFLRFFYRLFFFAVAIVNNSFIVNALNLNLHRSHFSGALQLFGLVENSLWLINCDHDYYLDCWCRLWDKTLVFLPILFYFIPVQGLLNFKLFSGALTVDHLPNYPILQSVSKKSPINHSNLISMWLRPKLNCRWPKKAGKLAKIANDFLFSLSVMNFFFLLFNFQSEREVF